MRTQEVKMRTEGLARTRSLKGHAEGQLMHGPDGKPVYIHADQLEVSPDGRWLYYQPCSGPLYRIETRDRRRPREQASMSVTAALRTHDTPLNYSHVPRFTRWSFDWKISGPRHGVLLSRSSSAWAPVRSGSK